MPDSPDDRSLAERAKAGDRKAFDELYAKYKRPIVNFAYRMIGNRQTAEEIAQETFIRVYMKIAHFDTRGKVSSWIYAIASNLAKNELRDRKYFHDIPLETPVAGGDRAVSLWQVIADGHARPDQEIQAREREESIQKVLDSIPLRYRDVLVLCDIQGLSYEEVSGVLGCPVGTIASRLSRARCIFMKRFGGQFREG